MIDAMEMAIARVIRLITGFVLNQDYKMRVMCGI